MKMRKRKAVFIAEAAIIASLYAVLTSLLWEFSSLAIQVRVSEALCVLPVFTSSAVPGLTIGCVIANMVRGNVIDAVFGSLATLISALLTRFLAIKLKKHSSEKWYAFLMPLPAVVVNALSIPLILYYGYGLCEFLGFESVFAVLGLYSLSVFLGQAIACYLLGMPIYYTVGKLYKKGNLEIY